jgi:hypothetical protein
MSTGTVLIPVTITIGGAPYHWQIRLGVRQLALLRRSSKECAFEPSDASVAAKAAEQRVLSQLQRFFLTENGARSAYYSWRCAGCPVAGEKVGP